MKAIVAIPAAQRTFANTVKAMETASADFADAVEPLGIMGYVDPSKDVREAARKMEIESGSFQVALWARDDVYRAFQEYADGNAKTEALAGQDLRLFEETGRGFKSSGHGLKAEDKAKLQQLRERLQKLSSEFEANIADDNQYMDVTLAELKGVPQSVIDDLEQPKPGVYRVTMKYPHYIPFMDYAENGERRKQLALMYANRAGDKNPALLEESLELKHQTAKILGYKNFPEMQLESRMAGHPQKVLDFLHRLWGMLRRRGEAELDALLAVKKADDPSATRVEPWERAFYSEKLRQQRYAFDEEEVRQYFPADRVISGTMNVYSKLFGVTFTEMPPADPYHADLRLLRLDDSKTGETLGYFYLDLYPREGKYSHAAVAGLIKGRELEDGSYQKPVALMMANFPKAGNGKPALLKHDDAITYLHEFGHGLHQIFTKAKYASMSGTSVARDVVEMPSQMLENFGWYPEVLAEISGHYQDTSKPLPAELFEKMKAARTFNQALFTMRQIALGLGDMMLHLVVPKDAVALFNEISELVSLSPTLPGSKSVASFGHIMAGYSAGYYGYLWSQVLADDAFSRFEEEGVLNPVVGRAWRDEVLAWGAARSEIESFKAYRGREPREDAFIRKLMGEPAKPADSGRGAGA